MVVDNSGYQLRNMGDVAMLQVAVQRIQRQWPGAEISVFTQRPSLLHRYLGPVFAIDPVTRESWRNGSILVGGFGAGRLHRALRLFRRTYPQTAGQVARILAKLGHGTAASAAEFMRVIERADLVVASGGGYLTDAFHDHAVAVMDTLELAQRMGVKTALLGQGVGPLLGANLLRRLKPIAQRAELFALREAGTGLSLLRSMDVPADRIFVTGDDAIELAYSIRQPEIGTGLGINLRIATYAGIAESEARSVGEVLGDFAKHVGARCRTIVISYHDGDADAASSGLVADDLLDDPVGDAFDTPQATVKRIGTCRLVATGSYHAGVFALAQGIPVVGITKSQYYVDKFRGLQQQFGNVGCEVVLIGQPDFEERLREALLRMWSDAEQLRPLILRSAEAQLRESLRVYDLLGKRVGAGKSMIPLCHV